MKNRYHLKDDLTSAHKHVNLNVIQITMHNTMHNTHYINNIIYLYLINNYIIKTRR